MYLSVCVYGCCVFRVTQAKAARQKRIDDMPEAERTALRTMKVYKYYPQNKFPDIERYKVGRALLLWW